MKSFVLQDRVVIALAYDCVDKMVYWTDITGPAISKASMSGGDVIPVVTKGTTTATNCSNDIIKTSSSLKIII